MFAALLSRIWALEEKLERMIQTVSDLRAEVSRLEQDLRQFRSKF